MSDGTAWLHGSVESPQLNCWTLPQNVKMPPGGQASHSILSIRTVVLMLDVLSSISTRRPEDYHFAIGSGEEKEQYIIPATSG